MWWSYQSLFLLIVYALAVGSTPHTTEFSFPKISQYLNLCMQCCVKQALLILQKYSWFVSVYSLFIKLWKRLLTGTVPFNNFLLTGTVPVNNSLLTGTLSNVRRCWLAMPLGAGVPYNGEKNEIYIFILVSLLIHMMNIY